MWLYAFNHIIIDFQPDRYKRYRDNFMQVITPRQMEREKRLKEIYDRHQQESSKWIQEMIDQRKEQKA